MLMPSRLLTHLLLLAAASAATVSAHADSLLGTSVSGTLSPGRTYYNATNFSSPAIIGPGVELKGTLNSPGYTYFNIDADFSDSALSISIVSPNAYGGLAGGNILSLQFTDSAFRTPFSLQSYSCSARACAGNGPTVTTSFDSANSTLKLLFSQISNGDTYVFTQDAAVAVTPEPNSLALAATGIAGMACMLRRRYAI